MEDRSGRRPRRLGLGFPAPRRRGGSAGLLFCAKCFLYFALSRRRPEAASDADEEGEGGSRGDGVRQSPSHERQARQHLQESDPPGDGDDNGNDDDDLQHSRFRYIVAFSLQDAVQRLEEAAMAMDMDMAATGSSEITALVLRVRIRARRRPPDPDLFGRFVSLLGRPQLAVRSVKFVGFAFEAGDGDNDGVGAREGGRGGGARPEDLERLMGSVLPAHPTLERIHFDSCSMPEELWGLFVRSLPTTAATTTTAEIPHKHLAVEGCLLNGGLVQPLAEMLRRNVRLSGLALLNSWQPMEPDACRLLCGSLAANSNLRHLSIDVADAAASGALEGALGPASPLTSLSVRGPFSREAVASLARMLRVNTTLARFAWITTTSSHNSSEGDSYDASHYALLEDTMRHCNFTLLQVPAWMQIRPNGGDGRGLRHLGTYLSRNEGIRCCSLLATSGRRRVGGGGGDYHVPATHLWPVLFGRLGEIPTLLYRLLRRGNLEALCKVVVTRQHQKSKEGGRRS